MPLSGGDKNFHSMAGAICKMTEGANLGTCSVKHDKANESDYVFEKGSHFSWELECMAFYLTQNWLFISK